MIGKMLAISLTFFIVVILFGCGSKGSAKNAVPIVTPPSSNSPPTSSVTFPNYSTRIITLASQKIIAKDGGFIENENIKIEFPENSLSKNTTIEIKQLINPRILPESNLNFIGKIYDLSSKGISFSSSGLTIHFDEIQMLQAGVVSKVTVKLYALDETLNKWVEVKEAYVDMNNNVVTAELHHFSLYSLIGLSGAPPLNLGKPHVGSMLCFYSSLAGIYGWFPGHYMEYLDTRKWDGSKPEFATEAVKRSGKFNVVESVPKVGVRRAYYKVPGTDSEYDSDAEDLPKGYRGARDPITNVTTQQYIAMAECCDKQVGKAYAFWQLVGNVPGAFDGSSCKGPDQFDCVGLIEKAAEEVGINGGQGIMQYDEGNTITPAWMYRLTKPAGSNDIGPKILWASFTPNKGTPDTQVLIQIAVSHPEGITRIKSVNYVTDDGFTNPDVQINDNGFYGDLIAGDGIYSFKTNAGGDMSMGSMGATFYVTDEDGNVAWARIIYTYTGNYSEVPAKALQQEYFEKSVTIF